MMNAIDFKNVNKIYNHAKALDDFNLEVAEGEVLAIAGPNGAGKTTMIRIITGLTLPTSGYISIFGKSSALELNNMRKEIGTLIEYPTFYKSMTGLENLMVNSKLKNVGGKERCCELLDFVKLPNDNKKVKNYSLGMKQRLGLAKALISDPKILILDEPTNGLDPLGIIEFRQLILDLKGKNKTIIICSHLLSELEHVADRFAFIKNGHIIKNVHTDEMRNMNSEIALEINDSRHAADILKSAYPYVNIEINSGSSLKIKFAEECIDINDIINCLKSKDSSINIYNISKSAMSLEELFRSIV